MFAETLADLPSGISALALDRPGWGLSDPPEDYRRTSVYEQASLVLAEARRHGFDRISVLGFGLGAVVGLEVALAEPRMVESVALIEPPLLGLLPEATAGVSADVEAIAEAVRSGGEQQAYELFLNGGLTSLGAGAERLGEFADRGLRAPRSFLVEVPVVPGWPLERVRFERLEAELRVVTLESTPALLERVAGRFMGWLDEGGIEAEGLDINETRLAGAFTQLLAAGRID